MLLLVLADNFLVLFVAWELVGLSSYLLIGFWYRKRSAALAAQEGVHRQPRRRRRLRAGDHGDLATDLGTLNIQRGRSTLPDRPSGATSRSPMSGHRAAVFCGAVGKSAQFPLHVWLPDAMEGPTPVSRADPRRDDGQRRRLPRGPRQPASSPSAPSAMVVVAAIGIFTAILAASIAFTQTDIKRVLAYSTLSQLGYMFAALGVGALDRGDLPPHDPRLLQGPAVPRLRIGDPRRPRGAGHAPDGRRCGEEDPDHLLDDAHRRRSPSPGIPPLAGFFSKDEILGEALQERLPRGSGRSASSSPS